MLIAYRYVSEWCLHPRLPEQYSQQFCRETNTSTVSSGDLAKDEEDEEDEAESLETMLEAGSVRFLCECEDDNNVCVCTSCVCALHAQAGR